MAKSKPTAASAAKDAFAIRLIALRQAYGASIGKPDLNRREFAELLGLQAETYRRYERAETEPSIFSLNAIRRLTGINLNALIGGEIDRGDTGSQAPPPALKRPSQPS